MEIIIFSELTILSKIYKISQSPFLFFIPSQNANREFCHKKIQKCAQEQKEIFKKVLRAKMIKDR